MSDEGFAPGEAPARAPDAAPGARRVIAVDPRDNVANALEPLAPGDTIEALGRRVTVRGAVPMGHKVALAPIAAGTAVLKYGEPIGHARGAIEPGEHVHVHNVESLFTDWLAARGLAGARP
ncbi:MAG: UxaA family hydrolase [Burkholderiaceae bacterium]